MFLYQVVSSCSCQSAGTWDSPPTHIAESQLCSADFYMLIRILTIRYTYKSDVHMPEGKQERG